MAMSIGTTLCLLCNENNDEVIWEDSLCHLISTKEKNQFGIHRLIWKVHVKELSDLSEKNRHHVFEQLTLAEKFVLNEFNPDKINLASMGNKIPHLHWHIIPRWKTDPWWPSTIWDKIRSPVWSNTLDKSTPCSGDSITIADWINLNTSIAYIRKEVFIKEQKLLPVDVWDEWDLVSRHTVIKKRNKPIATGRLHPNGKVGSIAVLKQFRQQGYGLKILKKLLSEAQSKNFPKIFTHAQVNAYEFYKKEGFHPEGAEFLECNLKHQKMVKYFNN